MFKKQLIVLYLSIASLLFVGISETTTLSELDVFTEAYPPYSYQQGKTLQGIAVDLLVASIAHTKLQFDPKSIRLMPWERAYRIVISEPNKVLFSMVRTESREHQFSWVGPIATTQVVLFARKQDNIKLNSIEELKQYDIGVIRDDISELQLLSSGVPKAKLRRGRSAKKMISCLSVGRINLWAYGERVGRHFINSSGLNPNQFEVIYRFKKNELYYAFSPDVDPQLLKKLQLGLDAVKQNIMDNGKTEYEDILNKYH